MAMRRFARHSNIALTVLGFVTAGASSSHAQAPSLGTAGSFAVLGGTTVTNTGASVLNGNVGVSPSGSLIGFPPGTVNGTTYVANAVAAQAQADDTTAYNALAGTPVTTNLTGQNLGGLTLTAGVYGYNAGAQLTGTLTLNAQGNPNAVFIFNIGSTLTTASAASIILINGAQANHVFFRVGSSATLGSGTSFVGDILALTSITLNTGASIICGDALAQNGAVSLNDNTITVCTPATNTGLSTALGLGLVSIASVLPGGGSGNQRSVANAIDAFVLNGGTLPAGFANLVMFLSPAQIADALTVLSGEAGTGAAQAGTQAMNSFLSLVVDPFGPDRPFADEAVRRPLIVKGPLPAETVVPEPRRWGVWGAGYGGQDNVSGDVYGTGSHDRSVNAYGYATGLDYLVTPDTVAGFALGGGGTRFGVVDNLGGGHSDMAQAAVYASTRIDAAYISAAIAYSWQREKTDRYLSLGETDHLSADYSANDVGGRIEGGYRFALPYVGLAGRTGFTPYAALQAQSFFTPSYSEYALAGLPSFALDYAAQTVITTRSELGAWFDWVMPEDHGTTLVLRARAAWANDHWSEPNINAMFQSLPGAGFTVTGAAPPRDSALATLSMELKFKNGISIGVRFDGEFAENSQKYFGTGIVRYIW